MRIINLSGKRLKNRPTLHGLRKFGIDTSNIEVLELETLKFVPHQMTQTYRDAAQRLNVEPGHNDVVIVPRIKSSDLVAKSLWPQATVIKFEYLTQGYSRHDTRTSKVSETKQAS